MYSYIVFNTRIFIALSLCGYCLFLYAMALRFTQIIAIEEHSSLASGFVSEIYSPSEISSVPDLAFYQSVDNYILFDLESCLGWTVFNISVSDLNENKTYLLKQFTDDTGNYILCDNVNDSDVKVKIWSHFGDTISKNISMTTNLHIKFNLKRLDNYVSLYSYDDSKINSDENFHISIFNFGCFNAYESNLTMSKISPDSILIVRDFPFAKRIVDAKTAEKIYEEISGLNRNYFNTISDCIDEKMYLLKINNKIRRFKKNDCNPLLIEYLLK